MTFPVPNLDDRTFVDLVLEARERARSSCPTWTDMSVNDPGMALIEVFAHLTEVMLYRLNRLPEKSYLTFLNLIGLTRQPPSAAWVDLTFQRDIRESDSEKPAITIPAGTRVSTAAGALQQATFVVTEEVVIPAAKDSAVVRGHHCTIVEAELLGTGTGRPGQRFSAAHPPLVITTEALPLVLGVQVVGDRDERRPAREYDGKEFEIWQPVDSFADIDLQDRSYVVDRSTGTITFAPDVSGAVVPSAGAEIRLWYRTGGGASGNVDASQLSSVEPRMDGVTVTNQQPAQGGRDLEEVGSALDRGPYEFFSLKRAVTARDYEVLATVGSGGVARARAFTRVDVRPFAQRGEVEVVLVPDVSGEDPPGGRLSLATMLVHEVEEARVRTTDELSNRGMIGTTCVTSWAKYKEVSVEGRVVVRPEEDAAAVRDRIHQRLNRTISPLPTKDNSTGWQFGESLRASTVYQLLEGAEPGVRYVDELRFVVGEAPDGQVRGTVSDPYQANTWYCGAGEVLFRSVNDGKGWESIWRFSGEDVMAIVPAPRAVRPGMVDRHGTLALATRRADTGSSRVYVSEDLGETWRMVNELGPAVNDIAWIERDTVPALLLASDGGLYELALLAEPPAPNLLNVEPAEQDRALYAVETAISEQGKWAVVVATQARQGIYLSVEGGRSGSFGQVGPTPAVDSRCLTIQTIGPSTVVWVGTGEPDLNKPGSGCLRGRLFEADLQWETLSNGWVGGTCWDIALDGGSAQAATQSAGVVMLDATAQNPSWTAPDANSGLPLRPEQRARFEAVQCADANAGTVIAGGPKGVYRSVEPGHWSPAANRISTDEVTIPDTWLLCSGEHNITVVGSYAQPDN
jgi:hypothetical protein